LEEIIRRASSLVKCKEFVLFGSQAVHSLTTEPPVDVLVSRECDIWLDNQPEIEQLLRKELGPESQYRDTKGFYLDPLPPDLPLVPLGWKQRLVNLNVDDIVLRCLEIHDLIVSKLAAGRLKDYEFIASVLMAKLARADEVVSRIRMFSDPHQQAVLLARLRIATEATDVRL
jgi:hypothetical protein